LNDKSRQELDADHHRTEPSSYAELASAFNDYKNNEYLNACVIADRVSAAGAKSAVSDMEQIFED
jgi:outer membrane protein assembly factor BamD (BamD/ComL family)